MKQVEGTWDATIRIIVWGVPIATVAIGLLILLFACLQPSYTATVKEVGETAYTPSRTMVRGHSSSYYSVILEVEYTNEQGALETTTVQFGSTNSNSLPTVGDQLQVSRGLTGMVTHPTERLDRRGRRSCRNWRVLPDSSPTDDVERQEARPLSFP